MKRKEKQILGATSSEKIIPEDIAEQLAGKDVWATLVNLGSSCESTGKGPR